jgi:hypothetical protein
LQSFVAEGKVLDLCRGEGKQGGQFAVAAAELRVAGDEPVVLGWAASGDGWGGAVVSDLAGDVGAAAAECGVGQPRRRVSIRRLGLVLVSPAGAEQILQVLANQGFGQVINSSNHGRTASLPVAGQEPNNLSSAFLEKIPKARVRDYASGPSASCPVGQAAVRA